MAINFYEIDTLVQFSTGFTEAANGSPIDPGDVTIYFEDPDGNMTNYTYSGAQVQRTSVGQYYFNFAPGLVGRWVYKWQGTLPAEVTSPDTFFVVRYTLFSPPL